MDAGNYLHDRSDGFHFPVIANAADLRIKNGCHVDKFSLMLGIVTTHIDAISNCYSRPSSAQMKI